MNELYTRIYSLCSEAGISGGKLCTEIGVRRSVLTDLKMERKQSLSSETLSKIADYFGTSVDYLLTGENINYVNGDKELTEYLEELKNRKEMRMLFSLAKGATKEDVEKTVAIVEAALGKKADYEC